jgi:hypothetical protein
MPLPDLNPEPPPGRRREVSERPALEEPRLYFPTISMSSMSKIRVELGGIAGGLPALP